MTGKRQGVPQKFIGEVVRSVEVSETAKRRIRSKLRSSLDVHRTGPADKYPYAEWFSGDDYEVLAEDYRIGAKALAEAIRKKARKCGIQVITWVIKNKSVGIKAIGVMDMGVKK